MDYKELLANRLAHITALPPADVYEMIEIPDDITMGDYALPCFKLSRVLKKAPHAIAEELAASYQKDPFLSKIEAVGGYLNFFLARIPFAQNLLQTIAEKKENFSASYEGEGKTIVIDYSSINIAKPFHIGHLSTTVIGHSLYRIYKHLGYRCVGVNHLGDWGTQFGKLIAAYKHWGDDALIAQNSIHAMLDLYVRFHKEAEIDPALEEEGRMWFKKIEDGDAEALRIFDWFKQLTLKEVKKTYDLLDITFDSYDGEAFYNDKMQPVIDLLKEKNLLEPSEGAYVVRLDEYDLPPCIILKSDGTSLYATRDLAAAFYRKNTYDFYKCLYVVAYQQNLHFKQIFKVLELLGCSWAADMEHVAFGMVSLEDGTLSTRKGRVVFLEDVLKQAIQKTRSIIEQKNPDLEEKDRIAEEIGVGAVMFSVLSSGRIKDIVFDLDKILNFDGETGPYLQYTHTRALSVLRKAGDAYQKIVPDYSALINDQAFYVLRLIEAFPEVVKRACEKNEPYLISRHLLDLAHAYNRYYFDNRIIDDEKEKTAARLFMSTSVVMVLKTGLYLLGIKAPDRM